MGVTGYTKVGTEDSNKDKGKRKKTSPYADTKHGAEIQQSPKISFLEIPVGKISESPLTPISQGTGLRSPIVQTPETPVFSHIRFHSRQCEEDDDNSSIIAVPEHVVSYGFITEGRQFSLGFKNRITFCYIVRLFLHSIVSSIVFNGVNKAMSSNPMVQNFHKNRIVKPKNMWEHIAGFMQHYFYYQEVQGTIVSSIATPLRKGIDKSLPYKTKKILEQDKQERRASIDNPLSILEEGSEGRISVRADDIPANSIPSDSSIPDENKRFTGVLDVSSAALTSTAARYGAKFGMLLPIHPMIGGIIGSVIGVTTLKIAQAFGSNITVDNYAQTTFDYLAHYTSPVKSPLKHMMLAAVSGASHGTLYLPGLGTAIGASIGFFFGAINVFSYTKCGKKIASGLGKFCDGIGFDSSKRIATGKALMTLGKIGLGAMAGFMMGGPIGAGIGAGIVIGIEVYSAWKKYNCGPRIWNGLKTFYQHHFLRNKVLDESNHSLIESSIDSSRHDVEEAADKNTQGQEDIKIQGENELTITTFPTK